MSGSVAGFRVRGTFNPRALPALDPRRSRFRIQGPPRKAETPNCIALCYCTDLKGIAEANDLIHQRGGFGEPCQPVPPVVAEAYWKCGVFSIEEPT